MNKISKSGQGQHSVYSVEYTVLAGLLCTVHNGPPSLKYQDSRRFSSLGISSLCLVQPVECGYWSEPKAKRRHYKRQPNAYNMWDFMEHIMYILCVYKLLVEPVRTVKKRRKQSFFSYIVQESCRIPNCLLTVDKTRQNFPVR